MITDPYTRAMSAAADNMVTADRLAAEGRYEQAQYLASVTLQVAMMLSANEALFHGLHGAHIVEPEFPSVAADSGSLEFLGESRRPWWCKLLGSIK